MIARRLPWIGSAGWSYASRHSGLFGEGDSGLARYATRFNAVEINSSFYREHRQDTFRRWADSVPKDFGFAVKVHKTITHDNRLQGCGPALDRFVDQCGGLGRKLAGVLVQLPPSLVFDARIASTFFAMLRRRLESGLACEPRHPTWFGNEASTLFLRYDIARVAADPAPCDGAEAPLASTHWQYWRWHGTPRIYYSDYGETALCALAAAVRTHRDGSSKPWIIFDNTAHGFAAPNAARLQELLGKTASARRNGTRA